ncbi:MAG TPA: ATP-binding cassette domain-containing protein, partial [Chitinophagaceae bacterium]|nr:ATP-binding cassette domain-containing protein [Chitinophagaceae bacterium]
NNTILDEMKECGSQQTEQELRNLLGCFLFGGDDVDKKIKILSGGEKARVALAKTITSKANFLLLDEPTNHLDIHSVELLIDALKRYEGTLILVSHDRYFVSKLADTIWEIDDNKIREFKGNYDEWADWKERNIASNKKAAAENKQSAEAQKQAPVVTSKKETAAVKQTASQQNSQPINKETKKELQKQQKIFQQLESDIIKLTEKKTQIQASLSLPETYSDKNKFVQAEADLKKVAAELDQLNNKYEEVFEKIMELEAGEK